MKLTRRRFLQNAGITAAAVATWKIPKGVMASPVPAATMASGLPGSLGAREVTSVCEMCFWRCLLTGKIKNGRLVKLEGNPKSPANGTKLCARGNAGIKLLYDPDRLKYPMKRVGTRGEGKWQRITWDEALDTTAENLNRIKKEHGMESLALFYHGASAKFIEPFWHHIGNPNRTEPAFFQCRGSRDIGYLLTFGDSPGSPERMDMEKTRLMVFLGTHLGENIHVSHVMHYIEGLCNGAKLVVVDPRFSASAAKADKWLAIRPGTDTALLLAWINYIIQHGLYDKEFVAKYTTGFKKLKDSVKDCTLDWAAGLTDIPAGQIKETAELMGKLAPHVVIHCGRFVAWYGNDTQRSRALAILAAILGTYGVEGGMYLKSKPPRPKASLFQSDEEESDLEPISDKWPFPPPGTPSEGLIEATLTGKPYPIKSWVIWGSNPIQTIPASHRTIEALKKLDFVLAVDQIPNDQTLFADIILPQCTYLERYDNVYVGKDVKVPYISVRQPMIKPLYESRDPYWITKQLTERLGYSDCFPYKDAKEYVEKKLESVDLSLETLNKEEGVVTFPGKPYFTKENPPEFDTSDDKVQLYSEEMEDEDLDPIPRFEPTPAPPKGYVRLLSGRTPVHTFTRTRNNVWLNAEQPENDLWLNDQVAKKLGIKNGEEVCMENQRGVKTRPIKVKVTPGIRWDCVYIVHGYGQLSQHLTQAYHKGVSDGLTFAKNTLDPVTGANAMRVNFVRLIKDGKVLEMPELGPLPAGIPRFQM